MQTYCRVAPKKPIRPRWYKGLSMSLSLTTEVRMIKGVGPHRAELLAKRGIYTLDDLLHYLPFRYEDRIHFSNIRDIKPEGIYTIRAMGGRAAIYNLLVQDPTGQLPCKFFHGGYLEGRLKQGQLLVLHGKAEVDKMRPARIEMGNPQIELLSSVDHSAAAHEADKSATQEEIDSTEVGRIAPIYEAIGTFGSRSIRPTVYTARQPLHPP